MRDAQNGLMSNAVVIRRVKDTLRGSVYEQIKWGIYMLNAQEDWEIPESKLQMTYKPTGQVILFKGADNPKKLKSTKVFVGYVKYVWYEECDEFESYDKIRNINQSLCVVVLNIVYSTRLILLKVKETGVISKSLSKDQILT